MNEDSSIDQSFIENVHKVIEQNFENEQFGVDELAHQVGISRSHLHRKLHAFSQPSAIQLLKEFRLKEAQSNIGLGFFMVRPAWAMTLGWKSRTHLAVGSVS